MRFEADPVVWLFLKNMCEIRRDGLRIAFSVFLLLQVDNVAGQMNEELVEELYKMYRDAASSEPLSSLRRLFKNNRQYNVHVERLKEVNGFKKHNLLIKEILRSEANPIIYINNPVESKIPYTYLSLEEFKKALSERVEKDKETFEIAKKSMIKKVNLYRKPAKTTILTKRETKLDKTTFVTRAMSFDVNKIVTRAQLDKSKVLLTDVTFKLDMADTTHTKYKTKITELKKLETANKKALSTNVSTQPISLETKSSNMKHNNTLPKGMENMVDTTYSNYKTNITDIRIFKTSNEIDSSTHVSTQPSSKETKSNIIKQNDSITNVTENMADVTHFNYENNITELKTLETSSAIDLSTHVSIEPSSLESQSNILRNNSERNIIENLTESTTSDYITHENVTTVNIYSTFDNITTEVVTNVTELYTKKEKEEFKLEENALRSVGVFRTLEEKTHPTTELIPDEQLKDDMTSAMTTTEYTTQEEEESKAFTIRRKTSPQTTTKSRWRTLGRPRVFVGR